MFWCVENVVLFVSKWLISSSFFFMRSEENAWWDGNTFIRFSLKCMWCYVRFWVMSVRLMLLVMLYQCLNVDFYGLQYFLQRFSAIHINTASEIFSFWVNPKGMFPVAYSKIHLERRWFSYSWKTVLEVLIKHFCTLQKVLLSAPLNPCPPQLRSRVELRLYCSPHSCLIHGKPTP